MTDDPEMPDDWYDGPDDDDELDDIDEAEYACHGYFESRKGPFMCGAVGSEDCDECPFYRWLGLTNKQIDALEIDDE